MGQMKKLKILMVSNYAHFTGSEWYRNTIPAKYLNILGHQVDILSPRHRPLRNFDYDIVVFNRNYSDIFPEIIEMARSFGAKLIFDIDDLVMGQPKDKPSYEELTKESQTSLWLMNKVDLVTCTNASLKEQLEKHTFTPVVVIPNAIDLHKFKPRRKESERLRIGFAGSAHHPQDLNMILPVIHKLQKEHDFDFVLYGINSKEVLEQFDWTPEGKKECKKLLANLDKVKNLERHDPTDPFAYPKKLRSLDLDIGLCPLVDTIFNNCKSEIKLLEYTIVDTCPLTSNVLPYRDCAVYTAENNSEIWYNRIEKLILNPKLRQEIIAEQKAWVVAQRSAKNIMILYEHIYKKLLEEV